MTDISYFVNSKLGFVEIGEKWISFQLVLTLRYSFVTIATAKVLCCQAQMPAKNLVRVEQ
ncbi:conserved hypothetical protein [Vibrio cholerae RC385]|nr:conserved hypothetical protein [Vibrio cholerae RC385]